VTFAYPWVFLILPIAGFMLWRQWRLQREDSLGYSSTAPMAKAPKSFRQRMMWLPAFLRALTVLTLVTAISRPQFPVYEATMEREGIAIELLVDISSSMDMRMKRADGRDGSRLEVAKDVIKDFIAGNEDDLGGRDNDLIGMVTFARYADTICPLTLSHEALVFFTDELAINDRPNEDGTAYGDATALAAARLARLEERLNQSEDEKKATESIKSRIIVLLTDGENNCGQVLPLQAAALAKEWAIRIYTISITDPPKSQFVRVDGDETIEAARVRSSAERALEKMSDMTGGIFRTAHDFDTLQAVYQEIDQLERSQMRSTVKRVYAERFRWFAITALVLLGLELFLQSFWLRRAP